MDGTRITAYPVDNNMMIKLERKTFDTRETVERVTHNFDNAVKVEKLSRTRLNTMLGTGERNKTLERMYDMARNAIQIHRDVQICTDEIQTTQQF